MIIVDRIEEGIAVAYSDDIRLEIPVSELPHDIHEGSVLLKNGTKWACDYKAEEQRRAEIAGKLHGLFKSR